jgi:hypothetical protein
VDIFLGRVYATTTSTDVSHTGSETSAKDRKVDEVVGC